MGRLVLSSSKVFSSRFWDLLVTWRRVIPISASVTGGYRFPAAVLYDILFYIVFGPLKNFIGGIRA